MKKSLFLVSMVVLSFIAIQLHAADKNLSSPSSKFIIVFTSKAYWDGPSQSCLPRDKGCCFHIGFTTSFLIDGQISGEMNYSTSTGLVYSFNQRTGISKKTFEELCKTGKFYLDGTGTFSEEIIKLLKLPANYSLPSGYYPFKTDGEMVYVTFK